MEKKKIWDNRYELEKHFRRYVPLQKGDFDYKKEGYWLEYKNKPKMGDWILFRHIRDGSCSGGVCEKGMFISRPILAIVIGHTVWDQALVIQFVEEWRAFAHHNECYTSKDKGYSDLLIRFDYEIDSIQFWTDDIKILGHWKTKPAIKEMREALNKSLIPSGQAISTEEI